MTTFRVGDTEGSQAPPQPATNTTQASTPSIPDEVQEAALAKPVSFYEQKAATVHEAMNDIWKGTNFADVATKYNKSQDQLGQAFAVFGVQTMNMLEGQDIISR